MNIFCVSYLIIHDGHGILQVHPLTLQRLGLLLLHLIEHTASVGHIIKYLLDHLKRHSTLRYKVEHLGGVDHSPGKLREFFCQKLHQWNPGLGKLSQFLSTKHRSSADLAVGEYDTPHIHAKTGRHIGQTLRGLKKLVCLYPVRGQLLRV